MMIRCGACTSQHCLAISRDTCQPPEQDLICVCCRSATTMQFSQLDPGAFQRGTSKQAQHTPKEVAKGGPAPALGRNAPMPHVLSDPTHCDLPCACIKCRLRNSSIPLSQKSPIDRCQPSQQEQHRGYFHLCAHLIGGNSTTANCTVYLSKHNPTQRASREQLVDASLDLQAHAHLGRSPDRIESADAAATMGVFFEGLAGASFIRGRITLSGSRSVHPKKGRRSTSAHLLQPHMAD